MISRAESALVTELEALLRGAPVGADVTASVSVDLRVSLERFVPEVLRELHPEWAGESLDGVFVARAITTGPRSAQLVGSALLISDQRLTPLLAELSLSESGDSVRAFDLRVGEPGRGPLGISGPSYSSTAVVRHLWSVLSRTERVDWVFRAERKPAAPEFSL